MGRPDEQEFLFRHTLFQETAYRSLLRGERADLHRSVAGALERAYRGNEDGVAPILAYHFQQAGDDSRALHYLTLAAEAAANVYANQEAVEHYQNAIQLALRVDPDEERLIRLYTGCGRLHELTGDFKGAIRVYETMRAKSEELGCPGMGIKARVAEDTLYSSPSAVSDHQKAVERAQETLELARAAGDEESEARSLWNLSLAGFFTGDDTSSLEYGEQALAIARRTGDKELQAFIMNDLSRGNLYLEGQQRRGMELMDRAIELWRELDNLPMLADSMSGKAMFAAYSGKYAKALDLAEEALALNEEIDNPWGKSYSQYIMCMAYWDQGDYANAIRRAEESISWAEEAGFVVPQVHARTIQAWTLWDLGMPRRAMEVAQQAVEFAAASLPSWLPVPLAVQILIGLSQENAQVDGTFEALVRRMSDPDAEIFPMARMYGKLAEASYLMVRGDHEQALERADELADLQARLNFKNFTLDAMMVRAKAARSMGNSNQAQVWLEQARDLAEATGSGRMLWRILLNLSRCAQDAGQLEKSVELKGQARAALAKIVEPLEAEWRASFLRAPEAAAVWTE
jgi:tetratricopeptide (TPR) repeat protein